MMATETKEEADAVVSGLASLVTKQAADLGDWAMVAEEDCLKTASEAAERTCSPDSTESQLSRPPPMPSNFTNPSNQVEVSNLNYDASLADVAAQFGGVEALNGIRIAGRGVMRLEFHDHAGVEAALGQHGNTFMGRHLRVYPERGEPRNGNNNHHYEQRQPPRNQQQVPRQALPSAGRAGGGGGWQQPQYQQPPIVARPLQPTANGAIATATRPPVCPTSASRSGGGPLQRNVQHNQHIGAFPGENNFTRPIAQPPTRILQRPSGSTMNSSGTANSGPCSTSSPEPFQRSTSVHEGSSRQSVDSQPQTETTTRTQRAPRPSPFGNAKPVDTAAKLREFEERKKTEVVVDKAASEPAPPTPTTPSETPAADPSRSTERKDSVVSKKADADRQQPINTSTSSLATLPPQQQQRWKMEFTNSAFRGRGRGGGGGGGGHHHGPRPQQQRRASTNVNTTASSNSQQRTQ